MSDRTVVDNEALVIPHTGDLVAASAVLRAPNLGAKIQIFIMVKKSIGTLIW